ncbi:hypothetical protein XVE_4810 [Xanthomonas vesicatoria ATCC 35937]|uniref:Uncharacterized protein n=1 Tax=Xanthomonas vesicatoria ATCC 35937 TaxID=925775 RepID=F0BKJ5_9XANT|nr:hypothetical protein XVE_4810 [Xanthomonas vesicatoria ATCC 35937]
MHQRFVRFLSVIALGSFGYYVKGKVALPWSAWLLPATRPSSLLTLFVVLHLANTVILVAISLPIAMLLRSRLVRLRQPMLAALLIALCGLVAPTLQAVIFPRYVGTTVAISGAVDLIRFALVLPVLTWLLSSRLPSNNSFKPKPLRGSA